MAEPLDLAVAVEYTDVEASGEVEFRFSLANASVSLRSDKSQDGASDLALLVANLPDIWAQALTQMETDNEDVQ